jgi:hypothetical protein
MIMADDDNLVDNFLTAGLSMLWKLCLLFVINAIRIYRFSGGHQQTTFMSLEIPKYPRSSTDFLA